MKHLIVNAFYNGSPSQSWAGLWTHPDSTAESYNTLEYWLDLARTCEAGFLDGIFLADTLAISDVYEGKPDGAIRSGHFVPNLDPMLVIPSMAAVTKNLCFGITGNTTYEAPYLLARRLSTLDHLTNGRVAWNVVTGLFESAARAMGLKTHAEHAQRYEAADEYTRLMYRFWEESWEDDAAIRDKPNKVFSDPSKVHRINHEGKFLSLNAIHLSEPSPQRTPLIFAAGSSGTGLQFAATHAECAFIAYGRRDHVRKQVQQIKDMAVAAGRYADDVRTIVPATIIVEETDALAEERYQEYLGYVDGTGNLVARAALLGIDFSKYSPDDPVPSLTTNASRGATTALTTGAEKVMTIRDLMSYGPGRDLFLVGSPTTVAEKLVEWCEDTGIDGINLGRNVEPYGLRRFCELVVPELQARGAFKREYVEGSMRAKLFPGSNGRLTDRHPARKAAAA
jgi:FMN-dependent oxidoreductase (nitrilotriacetate monooxygenase family)